MVAPLAMACSSLSSTSTPAPSPITKPERSASKGLLAVFGLSFELVHLLRVGWRWGGVGGEGGVAGAHIARIDEKPAKPDGWNATSSTAFGAGWDWGRAGAGYSRTKLLPTRLRLAAAARDPRPC